jgi:UDP-N-acetylglucosamine 2-epimerase (non-hydrolysing)
MAPLVRALSEDVFFESRVCVTGQHRQMLDQALEVFGIVPDIDLNIMKPGQDLFDVTCATLLGLRDVLREEAPDLVLVHGDTTTALAASVAAFYSSIRVGHVEAGLRTFDLHAPFPEEFNRQVVAKASTWHFAPTEISRRNLLSGGVGPECAIVTGNTVIDALGFVLGRLRREPGRREAVDALLTGQLSFDFVAEPFVLVTGHRRENFGEPMRAICRSIRQLARRFPWMRFVYPVHLNPNVRGPVDELLVGVPNISLLDPLDYEPFARLLECCHLVLTDSGGIQEEAPSLGKPVLLMRDATERPEAVEAGTVRLVGANETRIVDAVTLLLSDDDAYRRMSRAHNPYGDGRACGRILAFLKSRFSHLGGVPVGNAARA